MLHHKPNGQTIADKMLFMVAATAAEMERELIHERTVDGLAAANAQGRYGGGLPRSTTTPSLSPVAAVHAASRSPRSHGT
jgi:DNA invertase Pin-like site-specific DNA recombinase